MSLEGHYGEKLLRDYSDYPMNTPVYERNKQALQANFADMQKLNGIECIHGHFLPVKYLLLSVEKDVTFITWLRNPVEMLVSFYHFW
ncbi:hypothetical protein L0Z72_05825, partial [candidate division KSB1 bacterium]|nr:hypothetical protein [candidate division KSB1 bacterium]